MFLFCYIVLIVCWGITFYNLIATTKRLEDLKVLRRNEKFDSERALNDLRHQIWEAEDRCEKNYRNYRDEKSLRMTLTAELKAAEEEKEALQNDVLRHSLNYDSQSTLSELMHDRWVDLALQNQRFKNGSLLFRLQYLLRPAVVCASLESGSPRPEDHHGSSDESPQRDGRAAEDSQRQTA